MAAIWSNGFSLIHLSFCIKLVFSLNGDKVTLFPQVHNIWVLGGLCILLGLWKVSNDVIYGNSSTWIPNIISNCGAQVQLLGPSCPGFVFRYLIWHILNPLASRFVFEGLRSLLCSGSPFYLAKLKPILTVCQRVIILKSLAAGVFCESFGFFCWASSFFHAIEFVFDRGWLFH